jgi:hypothetical protein
MRSEARGRPRANSMNFLPATRNSTPAGARWGCLVKGVSPGSAGQTYSAPAWASQADSTGALLHQSDDERQQQRASTVLPRQMCTGWPSGTVPCSSRSLARHGQPPSPIRTVPIVWPGGPVLAHSALLLCPARTARPQAGTFSGVGYQANQGLAPNSPGRADSAITLMLSCLPNSGRNHHRG